MLFNLSMVSRKNNINVITKERGNKQGVLLVLKNLVFMDGLLGFCGFISIIYGNRSRTRKNKKGCNYLIN